MPTDVQMANTLSQVLKHEDPSGYSRDKVTVLAAQVLYIGHVLGKVTAGAVPTTGTKTGTGDGTMTSVTGGKNTQVGIYKSTCIQAVSHGGVFEVTDPNGKHIGTVAITPGAGLTGVFTSDEINFTLTDGSTDFIYGDYFTVTVPAGGGQVRELDLDGVDGSQIACGVAYAAYSAAASGDKTIAYTSGGTYEVIPGDTIVGNTSGATARIVSQGLTSGTWAGGDAAGTFILDNVDGTFQSENLNVGDNSNVATVGEDASAVAAADIPGVMIARQAIVQSSKLIWPSGATTAQKAVALAELAAKGIIVNTEG